MKWRRTHRRSPSRSRPSREWRTKLPPDRLMCRTRCPSTQRGSTRRRSRLSRVRIGAPLAPLKLFTFGDQLVWALVAGIALILVPTRDALAAIGTSVLIFFGTLYALRGYGIYAWFISRRVAVTSVAVAVAAFPLSLVTVPWAVGLGVSDTWIDWRRRLKHSLTSGSDRS